MPSARGVPRLVLAVAASAALVLSGPVLGQVRGAIRAMFASAGTYVLFLNAFLAAIALATVALAIWRAPNRRALLAACAATVLLAAGGRWLAAPVNVSQAAVERFHFIEYGIVTWLFYRAFRVMRVEADDAAVLGLTVLAALLVGMADEWFQWFVPERIGEWPDIFLNGNAILAGLIFSLGLDPPRRVRFRWYRDSVSVILRLLAIVAVAFAAFLQIVHLGTRVTDEEIGAFMSRFDAGALRALSAERATRWRIAPPVVMRRYSREDQYLAEASWHVQARNEAWASDLRAAWFENRILEKYFSPALDVDSYVMPRSRWPDEQRQDAEQRVGSPSRMFESHANRLTLYRWSPWWLWGSALAIALLLVSFSRGRQG